MKIFVIVTMLMWYSVTAALAAVPLTDTKDNGLVVGYSFNNFHVNAAGNSLGMIRANEFSGMYSLSKKYALLVDYTQSQSKMDTSFKYTDLAVQYRIQSNGTLLFGAVKGQIDSQGIQYRKTQPYAGISSYSKLGETMNGYCTLKAGAKYFDGTIGFAFDLGPDAVADLHYRYIQTNDIVSGQDFKTTGMGVGLTYKF